MLVYVVGAGAVGTFLGEALRAAGCDVVYAPRNADDVVPVNADVAIVAVKSYDTRSAIETLQRALSPEADVTFLTPQNGVGNEELLARAFGADRVVSGALTVPLEREPGGAVVPSNRGGLALAPVGSVAHNWLVATFGRTEIPVSVQGDYRAMKWSKLALNIIANASCAILDIMPAQLVAQSDLFDLELSALREVRAVMGALDLGPVDLPRYPVRALFALLGLPSRVARPLLARRIGGARGRKPPSLLLDLRAGKGRTEVDALNGAIAVAGVAREIATPVSATYARVLDKIAGDPAAREVYRSRPEALLAVVEAERASASK